MGVDVPSIDADEDGLEDCLLCCVGVSDLWGDSNIFAEKEVEIPWISVKVIILDCTDIDQ